MKKIIKNTLISSRPYRFLSRFPNYFWFAFISLVIVITACDNPNLNNFKTPLALDTFGTRSVDTFSLIARTETMDSLPSYNFTKDLIGCINNDLYIGKVVASAYISFRLPSYTIKFPANAKCNSIILTLKYSGSTDYFGNITEPQTFRIFEVSEKLKYDSHYYSTSAPSIYSMPVGVWNGLLVPNDTLLKISLDTSFGNKLLRATDDQLSTNENFIDYFRGISIIPDDALISQGAIVYFLLNNSKTTISLYFNDTGLVVFPVNSYSARFNNFKHDYTGSKIQTQISQPQTEFNELILQPMAGTKVTIKIPYIKHMIDTGLIAINRAEIFFPVDPTSPYKDYLPASLLLLQTDSLNNLYSIIDRTETYYSGLLIKSNNRYGYSFNITRYIQQLLKSHLQNPGYIEKETLTLIIPSDNPITASPVILLNRDQNNNPAIKLKIWYSKL